MSPAAVSPRFTSTAELGVTYLEHLGSQKCRAVTLGQIADLIRTGGKHAGLREKTAAIRDKLRISKSGKSAVVELKKRLPAVIFSGLFSKRGDNNLHKAAGLVCVDLDGLTPDQIRALQLALRGEPALVLMFVSPTGTGLKLIFATGVSDGSKESHTAGYTTARNLLREFYGVTQAFDPTCGNRERLCFLCYDPEVYYNPNYTPLDKAWWPATPAAGPTPTVSDKSVRRTETYTDADADIQACVDRLAALPPAIEGDGGDAATFRACCIGRDLALSQDTFLPLIAVWNERCSPPWTPDELGQKVRNAYNYAKAATPGDRAPSHDFAEVLPASAPAAVAPSPEQLAAIDKQNEWQSELRTNKDGDPKATEANISLILRKDPRLEGLLRYNLFTSTVELGCNPPWGRRAEVGRDWADHDDIELLIWLQKSFPTTFEIAKVTRVVASVAKLYPYHPIRGYLQVLAWDKVPRLSLLLSRYFGATDSPYVQAISRCVMIAMVARVMRPGCKVDTMLILEGAQGTLKSSALAVLAGADYFTDAKIDIQSKDGVLAIRGKWLIEVGELESMRLPEAEQMKAWLSRQVDRQRDPYARRMSDVPRQSVFIGTTNRGEYLKDDTGNRRYWPVQVARVAIDLLKQDRDQLWAEAMAAYRADEHWWLTAEREQDAQAAQAERLQEDPWFSVISIWLETARDFDGKSLDKVTAGEVMQQPLGLMASQQSVFNSTRVGNVMKRLGWGRQTIRVGGKTTKGFIRPERVQ